MTPSSPKRFTAFSYFHVVTNDADRLFVVSEEDNIYEYVFLRWTEEATGSPPSSVILYWRGNRTHVWTHVKNVFIRRDGTITRLTRADAMAKLAEWGATHTFDYDPFDNM